MQGRRYCELLLVNCVAPLYSNMTLAVWGLSFAASEMQTFIFFFQHCSSFHYLYWHFLIYFFSKCSRPSYTCRCKLKNNWNIIKKISNSIVYACLHSLISVSLSSCTPLVLPSALRPSGLELWASLCHQVALNGWKLLFWLDIFLLLSLSFPFLFFQDVFLSHPTTLFFEGGGGSFLFNLAILCLEKVVSNATFLIFYTHSLENS